MPGPSSKKWFIMAAVAMGLFLATIDGSIVNIALPTLARALNVDFSVVEWVVLAYLVTVTTLILGVGRLADMIGRKKIYITGLVVFTIGSALCGISSNISLLICFRVFQAIGAAMIMALGSAIVTETFPPAERGKALGIMGTVVSIGIITGPSIGGILLDSLSWHWLFFINVPIGIFSVIYVMRILPENHPQGGEKFDFTGALFLFISLISLLLGLFFSQESGFENFAVIALLSIFIIFIGGFIFLELRNPQLMIDLRLFRNALFSINLITGFLSFIATAGITILMPFYLQNILNFNPREAGLLLGVVPLTVGLVAPLAGYLSDRFGPRPLTSLGLLVLIIGYIAVSTLDANTTALSYAIRFFPVGLGLGLFQSPNNSAVMGTAPKNRLGIVSGLLAITRTLGQTSGIAILGAIWAARIGFYNHSIVTDATQAPVGLQIAGLHDTIIFVVFMISAAFMLSLWALYQGTIKKPTAVIPKDTTVGK